MKHDCIPDVTCCIGCGLKCPVGKDNKFESVLCENKKIAIWPEDNFFFTASLNSLLLKKVECHITEDVILVDFCIENILLFLNDSWIKKLSGFNMKIILISDRKMKSMARYWFNRKEEISEFLVVGEGMEKFIHDAKKVLCGKKIDHRGIAEITEKEMDVLRLLAKGTAINDISKKLGCPVKSIYNHQYSLCSKFGGLTRLDQLRLKHRVSW